MYAVEVYFGLIVCPVSRWYRLKYDKYYLHHTYYVSPFIQLSFL